MNTINTKLVVDENEIVTLVADKTRNNEEIDRVLIAFGNELAALPFYAIYPADGRPAITLDGLVSESRFIEALREAGPSRPTLTWQPFSPETLEKVREEGRTVLINFTADWDVTSKVNEAVALNTTETKLVVEENGIVTLVADKTRDNEEVDQLLIALGNEAKATPFYAIFPADGRPPITLGGQITEGQIIEALREAGPSRTSTDETEVALVAED